MGACPERIISFKNYSVDMIGSMIKGINVPEEDEEKPRVICLVCENDALPAIDMAAAKGHKWSPYVRFIPVRCLGSINLVWIADALSSGIDGVMLFGCRRGDDYQCHFIKGSELANVRMSKVSETLTRLVLEAERVQVSEVSITDVDKVPELINSFMETIESVGPNPYKGF
jgi:quinone-modifying oxidoreductase subunit QmoB